MPADMTKGIKRPKMGKNQTQFTRIPTTWRRTDVLVASLLTNILALSLPFVILQVYDRIIPNQAIDTFIWLMVGMVTVAIFDAVIKTFRSAILSWEGARYDHLKSMQAVEHILHSDTTEFEKTPARILRR